MNAGNKNRVEMFVGDGFGWLLGCALSVQKKMVAKILLNGSICMTWI